MTIPPFVLIPLPYALDAAHRVSMVIKASLSKFSDHRIYNTTDPLF